MFSMVPVSQDDGVFLVVCVDFGRWMDNDRGSKAIDVLTLLYIL